MTSMALAGLSILAGFFGWVTAWVAGEKLLAIIFPRSFGDHQRAFEAALTNGGPFAANTRMLLIHFPLGAVVSLFSGSLTAWVAADPSTAPLILGFVLLALGILKAVLSWRYVPLWYHIAFTAMLLPLAVLGGKIPTML
jgi:hypothetical protein